MESQKVLSRDAEEQQSSANTDQEIDQSHTTMHLVGKSVDWSGEVDNPHTDEDIMQISGAGHWFLDGWIGDHAVDFLVDSRSAVTAVSRSFYETLREAGAPVGDLRPTVRRLRGANGSQIDISGCSSCVVSFLGLRTEFPILVCDLSTDAIIGTDTLGFILPHTLDIKNGLLFTEGGCHFSYIVGMQHYLDASSLWDIAQFHHIPRRSFIVLHARWEAGHCLPVAYTGKHRPGGRPDVGGSIGMEGSCVSVKLRSRNSHGGTIFRDWHDCPGVSDSGHYGPATSSVV